MAKFPDPLVIDDVECNWDPLYFRVAALVIVDNKLRLHKIALNELTTPLSRDLYFLMRLTIKNHRDECFRYGYVDKFLITDCEKYYGVIPYYDDKLNFSHRKNLMKCKVGNEITGSYINNYVAANIRLAARKFANKYLGK